MSTDPRDGERPRVADEWHPEWTIPPASILDGWLRKERLTVGAIAGRCSDRSSAARAIRDVFERMPLTQHHADLLAEATGIPARYWLGAEACYRQDLAAGRTDAPSAPFPLPGEERRD